MTVYNRKTATLYEEKQYKGKQLELLYTNALGRLLLKAVFASRWFSKLRAYSYNSKHSVKDIAGFVSEYDISMSDFESREFKSFNDFFTRRLKPGARTIEKSSDTLISPCDAKLTAYKIDEQLYIKVKNSVFGIQELIRDKSLAQKYALGDCLVFRLTADDCHRYIYFDSGLVISHKKINGVLHTVRPLAFTRYKVYCENSREYTVLKTQNFGICVYIEVGAMLIGKIQNNVLKSFNRADEKGFFEYGGSTIILLFEKGIVNIDDDIIKNSENSIETKILLGERIGIKC